MTGVGRADNTYVRPEFQRYRSLSPTERSPDSPTQQGSASRCKNRWSVSIAVSVGTLLPEQMHQMFQAVMMHRYEGNWGTLSAQGEADGTGMSDELYTAVRSEWKKSAQRNVTLVSDGVKGQHAGS